MEQTIIKAVEERGIKYSTDTSLVGKCRYGWICNNYEDHVGFAAAIADGMLRMNVYEISLLDVKDDGDKVSVIWWGKSIQTKL